jgi:hypothetical protein
MWKRICYQVCCFSFIVIFRELTLGYLCHAEQEINVHVGLKEIQWMWYRSVLKMGIDAVNSVLYIVCCLSHLSPGLTRKKEGKIRLMNMVMQVSLTKPSVRSVMLIVFMHSFRWRCMICCSLCRPTLSCRIFCLLLSFILGVRYVFRPS